jgi:hypothetical protein
MIEIVEFNIVGVKPLMQANPASREKEELSLIEGVIGKAKLRNATDSFKEAAGLLYATSDGAFYHPGRAFWSAMVFALPNHPIEFIDPNGKRTTKAANGFLPKAVETAEEHFILCDPGTLRKKTPRPLAAKEWLVDRRGVPVQTSTGKPKGSVLASRPKWPKWGGILRFEVDTRIVPMGSMGVIVEIMNDAGRSGVGVGRLRKNGMTWSGLGTGKFRCELRK